jgi:predicted transcriptional regulator
MSRTFEGLSHYPDSPGFTEPTTSRDAAEIIARDINARQREVLDVYRIAGDAGLTADEAAAKLGRSVLAVRPRVTELRALGLIEKTKERRANESGLAASVSRFKR